MFLADLISNCFFEVNDINILCFQGPQSFTVVEEHRMLIIYCTVVGVMQVLCIAVMFRIFGKFDGKH